MFDGIKKMGASTYIVPVSGSRTGSFESRTKDSFRVTEYVCNVTIYNPSLACAVSRWKINQPGTACIVVMGWLLTKIDTDSFAGNCSPVNVNLLVGAPCLKLMYSVGPFGAGVDVAVGARLCAPVKLFA